jgi:hypothetical protein
MYPNPGLFAVRADSPYQGIEDLRGKLVAFGTRSCGLRILAGDVLDGIGLIPERDFEQVILEIAADGPRLVLEGEVEALWGAGIGWPGFVKIANGPKAARFIPPIGCAGRAYPREASALASHVGPRRHLIEDRKQRSTPWVSGPSSWSVPSFPRIPFFASRPRCTKVKSSWQGAWSKGDTQPSEIP